MNRMEYNQELLHTPEGVRDIYGTECAVKLDVQNRIHQIMTLYGFKDIQTPSFEFFDIFSKERGTVMSKEMYKFFDRQNNTLVLRPDITPSIARCVSKYYSEEDLQIRLCYIGNTFVNNISYQGKLKEVTQAGAELVNDSSSDADAEMVALMIECLLSTGLKEFQVGIGHADFFYGLLEEGDFSQEETVQLKNLLENKNIFGIEELISSKKIDEDLKELIIKLPELFGNVENLSFAKSKTKNERALKAIERLEKLNEILETYGFSKYVTFDLGMLSKYTYYTGIIFKAYTYGTGEAIATGGRYDKLMQQFGKQADAIGLAIVIDQLMLALSRQKLVGDIDCNGTLILYQSSDRNVAVKLANHFRSQGLPTQLMRKSSETDMDHYKKYCEQNYFGGILHIVNEDSIRIYNVNEHTENELDLKEFIQAQGGTL